MPRLSRIVSFLAPALVGATILCAGARGAAGATGGEGRTLVDALADLRSRGLRLIFSSGIVRPDMLVAVEPSGATPREVLDALLAAHDLEAVAGPAGVLLVVARDAAPAPRGAIEGLVRSAHGGRPVAGAAVTLVGTGATTTTGRDGTFHLEAVPAGFRDLEVNVPGLRRQRFEGIEVRAGLRTRVTLDLRIVPTLVETIVVSPRPPPIDEPRTGGGRALDAAALGRVPRLGGDLMRGLAHLPGVAAADTSAALSMRGGETAETRLILDGLEIPEPYHLDRMMRFAGIIDPRALRGVEVRTGGLPAEFGDTTGGVVEMVTATGDRPPGTILGAGSTHARLTTTGPAGERGGSWIVSGRAWYPDAVLDLVDPGGEDINPSSADLLGRVERPLGDGAVLAANVLMTRDRVDFQGEDTPAAAEVAYDGRYAWASLTLSPSAGLLSRTILSAGQVGSDRRGSSLVPFGGAGRVEDRRSHAFAGLKQDWTFDVADRHHLKWGAAATRQASTYDYANASVSGAGDAEAVDIRTAPAGWALGGYVADRIRPSAPLALEIGARWDRQSWTGQSQLSPRFNIALATGPGGVVRASWGLFHDVQGLNELQVEDGVAAFHRAQRAAIATIGFEQAPTARWRWSVEAYLKRITEPRPRYENAVDPIALLPEIEPDRMLVAPDRSSAKGVEFSLAMDAGGRLRWWGNWAIASVEDEIDGARVPRSWDQRHAVSLGLHWRAARAWSFGAAWAYHSGWPATPVSATVTRGADGATVIEARQGERNSARYPAYHRLDVEVRRRFDLDRGSVSLFLGVTNLYNRKNVCCLEGLDSRRLPDGSLEVRPDYGYWMEQAPEFGLVWEF